MSIIGNPQKRAFLAVYYLYEVTIFPLIFCNILQSFSFSVSRPL